MYASFGHSARGFDNQVSPAEDERDNVLNVAPHVEYAGNAVYEYLPGLSRGTGEPQPAARLEFTTVELVPEGAQAFESALKESQSKLQGETLWYRMVAGGEAPRYVRLRPRPSVSAVIDARSEQLLPDSINHFITRTTVEILTLRPTMSLGLPSPSPQ
jgi:hypothetical protein